ncbi:receptor-type guanylate cyclase Gyc76C-like [Mya arenaria]|nr:receptor-type guanylate cyclase Gyc76C-like [Mya arenaria]XP_052770332.1 receptor-type guanylate cyclase Gyc76C-like [Mya arenaria]
MVCSYKVCLSICTILQTFFSLGYTSKFDGVKDVENITIGYLTVDKTDGFMRGKQGRLISGAISYAIELINNDTSILPRHRLKLTWGDTQADTLVGTRVLTSQWRRGARAFIGLEDSCSVEAKVAAAWNLPMISYKCADYDVSDKEQFPTFARTFPPATQVAKPIISLLLHYNWMKFTLVYGSLYNSMVIADKIRELAKLNNITLNDEETFEDPHIPLTMPNPFPGIVERTFVDTRVYVFLGTYNGIVDMMTNMYDRGLLDTGEYVVIYFDHETLDAIEPLKYYSRTTDPPMTKTNEEAVRSLLVITGSPPTNPHYESFKRTVTLYCEKEPFSFPNIEGYVRRTTVFAAYLYDAVLLYAKAVHEVIEAAGSVTNGTAIVEKILDTNYTSIQGYQVHIDKNGDAEGNYTLLSRQPYKTNLSDYSMLPVGHFQIGRVSSGPPVLRLYDGMDILWVSGESPIDEPRCGYRAQRCIPPKRYTFEILGGVIGGIALVLIIIALVIYRNWRYEQEIAGLLWKIPREDLKTSESSDRRDSFGSRMTLSQLSMDSRMSYTQVYARTGGYRGQIVALKMYEKKHLYISRKTKKEMKLMRDLRHNNINAFLGACIDPPVFIIVTEYCSKGSLTDILENEDVKLDNMFLSSLVKDIIQGMTFLHESELVYHGNLKSSNCVVTSRWTLQITDFGLLEVRAATYKIEEEHAFHRNLFWKAPEHLRTSLSKGSQNGDIYSFAIVLHEIFGRRGPYGFCNMTPKEVIDRVRNDSNSVPFRPNTSLLSCDSFIIECMQTCWEESPDNRPDFRGVRKLLDPLWRHGTRRNIMDKMMAMMEKYQKNLEDIVEERTTALMEEKKKTEALLLRMLPRCVADQLKSGEAVVPECYNCVTIYFSDICGFTHLSAESTPMQVVDMLNDLYTIFDNTIRNFDVYKIETIGDAYMVVSGLPIRNGDSHAGEIASMSLQLLRHIKSFTVRHIPDYHMSLRIGMHSGPCVAGVVGLTMPRYTLFGDTVNTASRMETNGEPMKIHCSQESRDILVSLGGYTLESRGKVPMKGKGELHTFWLLSEDESVRNIRVRKSSKTLTEIYSNCYFQPSTPKISHRGLSGRIKHSPQNPSYRCSQHDSDDNYNIQDNNRPLLELLRDSENKASHCDSPVQNSFHSPAFHSSGKETHSSSVQGLNTVHINLKAPVNGIMADVYVKSSSSNPDMNSNHNTPRCYEVVNENNGEISSNAGENIRETDSLLSSSSPTSNKAENKCGFGSSIRGDNHPLSNNTELDNLTSDNCTNEPTLLTMKSSI